MIVAAKTVSIEDREFILSESESQRFRQNGISHSQGATRIKIGDGGRYRIRTYDFHRVKVALYR